MHRLGSHAPARMQTSQDDDYSEESQDTIVNKSANSSKVGMVRLWSLNGNQQQVLGRSVIFHRLPG